MVLSTRTSCSFRWRACMELRCACRSTNISETSRFEYSIRYIRRLMAISSTENAQCGVLTPALDHLLKHRFEPCCTAQECIARTIVYSGLFLATGLAPALAADPTGDWQVADGVANIRVAQCNGSMWGVGCLGKDAGRHATRTIRMPAKQSRPTLGMPILIDMKKKPGVDPWEGQVYNAKDGQLYSSTIKPVGTDQLEIQGCVLGFLCGGETWTRVGPPIPSSPANSMAKGAPKGQPARRQRPQQPAAPAAPKTTGAANPAPPPQGRARSEAGGRPARRYRRYLPTPRHRAVCPLAPAGTAAPRRAW